MPRNSAGVYTLPAGNPVITNTPIESDGWANPTLSDIANEITNSLDRSGRGGMTGPFGIVDGTAAAPGLRFTTDPNNGLYRVGPDDWWASAGAVPVLQFQPTGITVPAGVTARWLGTPSSDTDLTPKSYVDGLADAVLADVDATYLKLIGGTLVGNLQMNAQIIFGNGDPPTATPWILRCDLTPTSDNFQLFNANTGTLAFEVDPVTNVFKAWGGIDIPTDAPNGINFKANASALYSFGNSVGFYIPDGVEWQISGTAGRLATLTPAGNFSVLGGLGASGTVSAGTGGSIFADWMRIRKADNTSWYHLAIAGDGGMQIWDYAFSAIMMQVTQAGDIRGRRIIATASP